MLRRDGPPDRTPSAWRQQRHRFDENQHLLESDVRRESGPLAEGRARRSRSVPEVVRVQSGGAGRVESVRVEQLDDTVTEKFQSAVRPAPRSRRNQIFQFQIIKRSALYFYLTNTKCAQFRCCLLPGDVAVATGSARRKVGSARVPGGLPHRSL